MRKVRLVALASLLVLLLVACAPEAPPAPAPTPAPAVPATVAPLAKEPTRQAWEQEWDEVVAGAKKEGRILVYGTAAEFRLLWSAAMERYGVKVEMILGRAPDFGEKILAERRAGIYSGDVYIDAALPSLPSLKPKGAFDPMDDALILPEVKDPQMWFQGRLPFLDKDHTHFTFLLYVFPALAINTNLVKPGEIKSYNDLLDPRWRGKIVMLDPTMSGSKFIHFASEILGWDYVRKLTEAKPTIVRDFRQMTEWLAFGKVAIALGPHAATLAGFRAVGAPVLPVIPQEGSWLSIGSGTCALLNKAPHPDARKVFLNWLFSKEGQTITSKATGSQSAREDVPTDFLDPLLVRDPSKKYYVFDTEEYLLNKAPENFRIAKEVFKDLLR